MSSSALPLVLLDPGLPTQVCSRSTGDATSSPSPTLRRRFGARSSTTSESTGVRSFGELAKSRQLTSSPSTLSSGLRGKRFLRPSDRPTTFITARGKTLEPDLEKAVENDRTMKSVDPGPTRSHYLPENGADAAGLSRCLTRRGTKIHKQLEREIHPVEIKVAVNSKEETWALRVRP